MPKTTFETPDKFSIFGKLLRFLRRRANLTQRELSIAVGYSESQISRLEHNERAPDEAILMVRFIHALNIADEPDWATRLLELGAATHTNASHPMVKPTPHNLPNYLTSFIGREKEIAEIKRLLTMSDKDGDTEQHVRLLTITGHGGCGKTRLALQVASNLLEAFPDGVWLLELAPLADPLFVPQTMATVLGIKEETDRPIISTLTKILHRKRMLLILDNCEHLIQASAQLAESLLHACPYLYFITTSRETLGIAGERVFYVPSLSTPNQHPLASTRLLAQYEAVRLFSDRAAIFVPGFTITNDNAAAITQICQQLDGIPLAIELAAARIKILSEAQISTRLANAFGLLTNASHAALPRHQTLQTTMDWSYDLLSDAEQRLFNRLSIFAGGWTLEAAEAVCAGEGIESAEILDGLMRLVNKSLILVTQEQAAERRFHMLEIIRQYAMAKLKASGETDSIQQRHAEYYLKLVEAGSQKNNLAFPAWLAQNPLLLPAWLDRIELEHDNLRAALNWSFSAICSTNRGAIDIGLRLTVMMVSFWIWRSYPNEYHKWVQTALESSDAKGGLLTRAQAWLLLIQVDAADSLEKDYVTRVSVMSQSLKFFQESEDRFSAAWTLHRLGWLAREHGDTDTARLRLEQSLTLYRELDDKQGLKIVLVTLGEVAMMLGDAAWAIALLEESLTLSDQLDDTLTIGFAFNHLGHVAQIQGEYERARQLHNESLRLFDKIGTRHVGTIWAYQGLGETALGQNDSTCAAKHITRALELSRELRETEITAWCLAGLAGAAVLAEDPDCAAWLWGAADALRQSIEVREAPASHSTHARLQAEARQQLGDARFKTCWSEGQSASIDQAIAKAQFLSDRMGNS